jgi:hypothetical protein
VQDTDHQSSVIKEGQEVLRVVRVDGEGARRCPKVPSDVSLDVGHIELGLVAGDHHDQSTLQRPR